MDDFLASSWLTHDEEAAAGPVKSRGVPISERAAGAGTTNLTQVHSKPSCPIRVASAS